MSVNRFIVIVFSLVVALVGILAACAAPTPTPTQSSTPTATPTPTLKPGLAQIIEGAKKEGTVSAKLKSTFTPKSIERLQREIKEMFGVDLDIKFVPNVSMPTDASDALLEQSAGATPTYDIMTLGVDHILPILGKGLFELVKWSSLLPPDVSPKVVVTSPPGELGLSYYSTEQILMYNAEKVRADQVPQTLRDLADPRWKGKIGLPSYPSTYMRWSYTLGKDKVLADIRSILANKAIQGRFADIQARFLLGEIWLTPIGDSYWLESKEKGMPAAWELLEHVEISPRPAVIRTGAKNPNAAKLVAIYLASEAGAKFTLEEGGGANYAYPGNHAHDILARAKLKMVPIVNLGEDLGMQRFILSDEFALGEKEVDLIFKGAGYR